MIKLRLALWLLPLVSTSVLGGSYGSTSSINDSGSDLPEDQVEEVLALYRKHCRTGYGTGYGSYGPPPSSIGGGYGSGYGSSSRPNVNIVCKEGNEHYAPPKKQIIRIPTQKPRKNIVFVEAPTLKLKHQINLISNGEPGKRTVIYVLPQKASHSLKVWDKRGQIASTKPQLFFLKNDKLPHHQPIPEYYPQKPVEGGYGVPAQQQPVFVTTPRPVYGLPVTTYRPSTGYETVVLQPTPQPPPPSSEYGSPPKQQYSLLQSGGGLVPFDPSSLGPEYEIVPADQGTRNAYQNLFALGAGGFQSPSPSQIQPQFQLQTETTYEGLGGGESASEPETLVQPLSSSSLYKSVDSNGAYAGGKLQFPSESIQNYQIQPFDEGKKHEPSVGVKTSDEDSDDDDLTDAEAEKHIKSLISAYESRQTSTTTPSTVTSPTTTTTTTISTTPTPITTTTTENNFQPRRLSTDLFNEKFVRALISSAKSASNSNNNNNDESGAISNPINSNNYSNVVFRYFRNSDQQLNSLRPPPQLQQGDDDATPNNRVTSSSSKRSIDKPTFEFFPANFVSYSYTKVDADKTN